ncbi:MAG: EVE domain-containing protein [Sedimenticola selenatireducens]|uniref:EVE domain-containing protein n=2 Tax=Sedimenticola selenatireducens TaxID=191960 RepID=A0A557RZG6_9GAMM|nr:EVE domain-containing protein [Sedimenticola selenatireducens]TVT63130.1 MAG: EVE domain-containing protein [Sedimenticola selenatireducens]
MKRYWLMKTEPETYSIDDLKRDKSEHWDGIRNYQARNFMMQDMRVGDAVLFYHSNCKVPGIIGLAKVSKEAYPDFTAWDPEAKYYDPKSTSDNPRWFMVDVAYVKTFKEVISLSGMREMPELDGMRLLQKGNRLSIMPVEEGQFRHICKLAGC